MVRFCLKFLGKKNFKIQINIHNNNNNKIIRIQIPNKNNIVF